MTEPLPPFHVNAAQYPALAELQLMGVWSPQEPFTLRATPLTEIDSTYTQYYTRVLANSNQGSLDGNVQEMEMDAGPAAQ